LKLKKLALIAELVASLAVILTLVLLLLEVRGNTLAVKRQIAMDHYNSIFTSFIDPPTLLSAMKKVKAVDGMEHYVHAFMETYGLNDAEAYVWSRFLLQIWMGLLQDFDDNGPSERLAASIRPLLAFPDNNLFLEHFRFPEPFESYIDSVGAAAEMK
jgi:hypothetical protein